LLQPKFRFLFGRKARIFETILKPGTWSYLVRHWEIETFGWDDAKRILLLTLIQFVLELLLLLLLLLWPLLLHSIGFAKGGG